MARLAAATPRKLTVPSRGERKLGSAEWSTTASACGRNASPSGTILGRHIDDAPSLTVIADQEGNTGVLCVAQSPVTQD